MNTKYNVGVVIKALQQKGYFQSLAEPNLIAYNGQEASFLAGGEFRCQSSRAGAGVGGAAVTIQWKEYGCAADFHPTIAGDTIRLKVRPEVSSLDFNSGIQLSGFRVPALLKAVRGNGCRAARWTVVRDCGPATEYGPGERVEGADPWGHSDHRGTV